MIYKHGAEHGAWVGNNSSYCHCSGALVENTVLECKALGGNVSIRRLRKWENEVRCEAILRHSEYLHKNSQ